MGALVLAVVCSVSIQAVMRLGTKGEKPRYSLLAVNYLVCVLSALVLSFGDRPGEAAPGAGAWALGLGGVTGCLYLVSFLAMQYNILHNGVTLSGIFAKLGVIVPTVLGFLVFGEPVRPARLAGIAVTALSVAVFAGAGETAGQGKTAGAGGIGALLFLLAANGMADGMSKFYSAFGDEALSGRYLVFVFLTALILCAALCLYQKERPGKRDALFGLLLGIPNVLCSRFLLMALQSVPATVAYPLFSCGTVLLTALCGRFFFGEKLNRRQAAALGLVLPAVILLNL